MAQLLKELKKKILLHLYHIPLTFPPLQDTNKLDLPRDLSSRPAPVLKKDWMLKSGCNDIPQYH